MDRQTDKWPVTFFKCSVSLVIKEMQSETTLRYHLTQSGIKKPQVWDLSSQGASTHV